MSNYERNRDLEIIGYNKNIIVTMYYLKEILSRLDVDYLKHRSKVCHGKAPIDTSDPKLKLSKNDLDGAFLTEAMVFLEAAIQYLLAYKSLVCNKYLGVAKVSLYYANFHAINCLLRLHGNALVHLSTENNTFKVELTRSDSKEYTITFCKKNDHNWVWDGLATNFPEYAPSKDQHDQEFIKGFNRYSIDDRMMWNYDPKYLSQCTLHFAQKELQSRCDNNFLDPDFGKYALSAEHAEYLHDLIADIGWEEGAAGDFIHLGIRYLCAIAVKSQCRKTYLGYFNNVCEDLKLFKCKEETKQTIAGWVEDAKKGLLNSSER